MEKSSIDDEGMREEEYKRDDVTAAIHSVYFVRTSEMASSCLAFGAVLGAATGGLSGGVGKFFDDNKAKAQLAGAVAGAVVGGVSGGLIGVATAGALSATMGAVGGASAGTISGSVLGYNTAGITYTKDGEKQPIKQSDSE